MLHCMDGNYTDFYDVQGFLTTLNIGGQVCRYVNVNSCVMCRSAEVRLEAHLVSQKNKWTLA